MQAQAAALDVSLSPLSSIDSITPSVPPSAPPAFPSTAVQALPKEVIIPPLAVGAAATVTRVCVLFGLVDLVVWQQQMP